MPGENYRAKSGSQAEYQPISAETDASQVSYGTDHAQEYKQITVSHSDLKQAAENLIHLMEGGDQDAIAHSMGVRVYEALGNYGEKLQDIRMVEVINGYDPFGPMPDEPLDKDPTIDLGEHSLTEVLQRDCPTGASGFTDRWDGVLTFYTVKHAHRTHYDESGRLEMMTLRLPQTAEAGTGTPYY